MVRICDIDFTEKILLLFLMALFVFLGGVVGYCARDLFGEIRPEPNIRHQCNESRIDILEGRLNKLEEKAVFVYEQEK